MPPAKKHSEHCVWRKTQNFRTFQKLHGVSLSPFAFMYSILAVKCLNLLKKRLIIKEITTPTNCPLTNKPSVWTAEKKFFWATVLRLRTEREHNICRDDNPTILAPNES